MTEQARIYGTVLYELAIPEAVVKDTIELFETNPQLTCVLASPVVQADKKREIIDRVVERGFSETGVSGLLARFLKKACDAGCMDQIREIGRAWDLCYMKEHGIMETELFYVTMPDPVQIEGIKQFLCRRYKKKEVRLSLKEEPGLMGGFVLKAGDMEYDHSLRGQLLKLSRAVTG